MLGTIPSVVSSTDTGFMSSSGAATMQGKNPGTGEVELIATRFGEVKINRAQAITFPRGLLGMPDKFHYCITEFPSEKLRQRFKLLQSVDDFALSFITLPLDLENPIISKAHLAEVAAELEVPLPDLAVLLIVSVHRGVGGVRLSVNARAPVIIDASQKLAAQYVFPNEHYALQHYISA